MDHKTRLLLIGARAHRETFARALPECEVLPAQGALEGLWRSGRQEFDGAFVSLGVGPKALRVVSSLRRIAPGMRIVVGCAPTDEPVARRALAEGADDYLLEPITPEDVKSAYSGRAAPRVAVARSFPSTRDAALPSRREISALSEILRDLADGVQATLDRMARLIRDTFGAAGVVIRVADLSCTLGEADDPVLEELIHRQGQPVGSVTLARRVHGAYGANAAARLAEYAHLIEATVAQAAERQRWQNLAWADDLSGLHNRRYFEQTLDELVQCATEQRLRLTVMLFDIDDFKTYNDRFGHDTGDRLIREVAVLLKRCTRRRDVVARYGGDEFAVVFWDSEKQRVPGSAHPREPIELAQRFCQAISEHAFECLGSDAPGPVTISGGLACFPWNGGTRGQLVAAADEALLAAKRTGKNRISLAGNANTEDAQSD